MLKLLIIQRNGATTHQVLSPDANFNTVIELVNFDNFEREQMVGNANKTIFVPETATRYTFLEVNGANPC